MNHRFLIYNYYYCFFILKLSTDFYTAYFWIRPSLSFLTFFWVTESHKQKSCGDNFLGGNKIISCFFSNLWQYIKHHFEIINMTIINICIRVIKYIPKINTYLKTNKTSVIFIIKREGLLLWHLKGTVGERSLEITTTVPLNRYNKANEYCFDIYKGMQRTPLSRTSLNQQTKNYHLIAIRLVNYLVRNSVIVANSNFWIPIFLQPNRVNLFISNLLHLLIFCLKYQRSMFPPPFLSFSLPWKGSSNKGELSYPILYLFDWLN